VRLRQMGAPAYVVSSALQGILNVRLMRLLCEECRELVEMNEDQKQLLPESDEWDAQKLAEPGACPTCMQTGHHGRTGLAEWMVPTEETAEYLRDNRTAAVLEETLETVFPARRIALEMLRDQRISLAEWQSQAGFYLDFKSSE
jgi:type II secretory ATPase GspE/PulE/Tfp pilus assembly ATPase PilB-like protein